jgi:hypothetical protein
MKTGRFINKLNRNVLAFYQTDNVENLLNKKNFEAVWNMQQSGKTIFPDDLAVASTVVKPDFDNAGRMILANDTVIVKFDYSDTQSILQALMGNGMQLNSRLDSYQAKNGFELKNPLPPVSL